jgi:hypothetical protein
MRRYLLSVILTCLGFFAQSVLAHEGHDHEEELTEQQVAKLATTTLPAVIKEKKLSTAWSKAQRQDITVQPAKDKVVWVVSHKNPDGKADGGKALYLFFDEFGNYVDANRSGEVPKK